MAKGLVGQLTVITVLGVMGLGVFSQVGQVVTDMVSSGSDEQLNQDFTEFADKLQAACESNQQGGNTSETYKDTYRGHVSLGDSSIQFADRSTVILVKGSERQEEKQIDCQVTPESEELEIQGVTTYTLDQQSSSELVVQVG